MFLTHTYGFSVKVGVVDDFSTEPHALHTESINLKKSIPSVNGRQYQGNIFLPLFFKSSQFMTMATSKEALESSKKTVSDTCTHISYPAKTCLLWFQHPECCFPFCRIPSFCGCTKICQCPLLRWGTLRTLSFHNPSCSFFMLCLCSTTMPFTGKSSNALGPTTTTQGSWAAAMTCCTSTVERSSKVQVQNEL